MEREGGQKGLLMSCFKEIKRTNLCEMNFSGDKKELTACTSRLLLAGGKMHLRETSIKTILSITSLGIGGKRYHF